ncbi:MAG: autotransporter outer membrane beta-barrel domain-containing protein [Alphaproteobacteria bacterium]|nr:autotransporter outer membrane beta-barrel domain-containing protein [Alphaproteobacteria bacterium]
MKTGTTARRGLKAALTATTSAMILAIAATSAHALPGRDDIYADGGSIDTANVWSGVGMMLVDPGFVCTGQLVNARTVLYAAHCSDSFANADYGSNFGGAGMAWGFNVSTRTELLDWFFSIDRATNEDNLVYNVLQVQTPFDGPVFDFPGGDVAMATLDTPVVGLPTYGMLFSPITETTAVNMVGYGTTGDGSRGPVDGLDWQRRTGTNMLDGLFSQADFLAATFAIASSEALGAFGPSAGQLIYHIDFDRPDRDDTDCARGPSGIGNDDDYTCASAFGGAPNTGLWTWAGDSFFLGTDNINWFGGGATDRESGTAGGDSGSGLFVERDGQQLVTGVLSGGWTFTSPFGGYGDLSYYNPIFLYQNWIIENNPYVYASAAAGDGNWSDAAHWQQDLDPNYFIIDENGDLVNGTNAGAPATVADALVSQDDRWGNILDVNVDDLPDAYTPPAPAPAPAEPDPTSVAASNNRGSVNLNGVSEKGNGILVQDSLGANLVTADSMVQSANLVTADSMTQSANLVTADTMTQSTNTVSADDMTYATSDLTMTSDSDGSTGGGVLAAAPGSALAALPAGWVPNNDWGAYGTWTGPTSGTTARFFDVTLGNSGTTTVDMNVEIDQFTINNSDATLDVQDGFTFNTLIAFNHTLGTVYIDGLVNAREYMLTSGVLSGTGELNTTNLWNVAGGVAPGRIGTIGDFTLTGNYTQTAAGSLWIDIGPNGTSDTITINGDASIDGMLVVTPVAGFMPRYGDTFQFATVTGTAGGQFASVSDLPGVLRPTVNYGLGSAELELQAASFFSQAEFDNDFQARTAFALDGARNTAYTELADIYGIIDLLEGEDLANAFTSMAPTDAIMFDRGVRSSTQVLTRALRNQIAFNGQESTGGGILAAVRQSEGSSANSALGQMARLGSVRNGHGDHSDGSNVRVFASGGISTGETMLINQNLDADFEGTHGLFGVDVALNDKFRVGAAAGFADSEMEANGVLVGNTADISSTLLSLFGSFNAHNIHASAAISFADHDLSSTRIVNLGGATAPLRADGGADGIVYDFLVAYNLTADQENFALSPFFSLTGSDTDFDAFSNTGSVGGLNVAGRSQQSLITRYGVNVEASTGVNSFNVYGAIAAEHEDDNDTYISSFTAAPAVTVAGTTALDLEDWAEFGASWSHELSMGATLTLSGDVLSGNDALSANTVAVEFSMPF